MPELSDQGLANEVFRALTGARYCVVCQEPRVDGRMVNGALFCSDCDSEFRFIWPEDAVPWHA